jgi:hypothetical protein
MCYNKLRAAQAAAQTPNSRALVNQESKRTMAKYTGEGTQQITRIPWPRPGMRVRVLTNEETLRKGIAGKTRQVRSLTAALTAADQPVRWIVHFLEGEQVDSRSVARLEEATHA